MVDWHKPDDLPPVEQGSEGHYILAVKRARNQKTYTYGAFYLNGFRLHFEYGGCPSEEECKNRNDDCEDGCPVTGWYDTSGDDDYAYRYNKIGLETGDEILGWAELPPFDGDW